MSFTFATQDDAEIYSSLKSLCNSNNGYFRSLKQAQFLFTRYSREYNLNHTSEQVLQHFGITVAADQVLVTATAYTSWANYGTRSQVPVMYGFVLDRHGVVAHYRIGGRGNLRDGWGPDVSKLQQVWTRDAAVACSWQYPTPAELAAEAAAQPVSQHVGTVGEKISRAMQVRRRNQISTMYGDSMRWEFVDSEGNVFVYFGVSRALSNVNTGDQVNLTVRVKKHAAWQGVNQTVVTFR